MVGIHDLTMFLFMDLEIEECVWESLKEKQGEIHQKRYFVQDWETWLKGMREGADSGGMTGGRESRG